MEEFRTWSEERVRDFFKPILPEDIHDLFVKCRFDGDTLEVVTLDDLDKGGLPIGPRLKIMRVVDKIRNNRNSNLKRKPMPCEPDTGNTDQIQAGGREAPRRRTSRHQSDTRGGVW